MNEALFEHCKLQEEYSKILTRVSSVAKVIHKQITIR